jgi:hypothetical protein
LYSIIDKHPDVYASGNKIVNKGGVQMARIVLRLLSRYGGSLSSFSQFERISCPDMICGSGFRGY